jgi:hypothetical protein
MILVSSLSGFFRRGLRAFFLALLCVPFISAAAFAACTGPPAGNAGDYLYNNDQHVMQYCDGTNWIAMGNSGLADSGLVSSGLVGWWKFDEGSGTSAADSSGNGNTGTLKNTPTWAAGHIGNAVSLNGTNQYVDVANPSNFNFDYNQPFTLAAWINRTSATTQDQILAKVDPTGWNPGYEFFMGANGATNQCQAGAGDTCTSNCLIADLQGVGASNERICIIANTTTVTTGAWHHVAVTYNGNGLASGITMYVDGVSQSAYVASDFLSSSTIRVSTDLYIGVDVPGVGDEFGGKMDDARVYNRALSAAEITTLYNYSSACASPPGNEGAMMYNNDYHVMQYCDGAHWQAMGSSGLIGWWKFDEGSGTSAGDSSGYGNTGTLKNTPTWAAGHIGNAVSLNGTNQYVDVANPWNFNFEHNQAFTLAAWINRNASSDVDDEMIDKLNQSGTPSGYSDWMPANGNTDIFGHGTPNNITCTANCVAMTLTDKSGNFLSVAATNTSAGAGAWHHIAFTYDGSNNSSGAKIYVDGVSQTLTTSSGGCTGCFTSTMTNTNDLFLGIDITANSFDYFHGSMDDVRIYNRALGAAEITALYNGSGGSGCTGPTGVEGAMFFNSASSVMEYCNGFTWIPIGKPL